MMWRLFWIMVSWQSYWFFMILYPDAGPQAHCQDKYCSKHEFCGKGYDGETHCLCRAIFASNYRSMDKFGMLTTMPDNCFVIFYLFFCWVTLVKSVFRWANGLQPFVCIDGHVLLPSSRERYRLHKASLEWWAMQRCHRQWNPHGEIQLLSGHHLRCSHQGKKLYSCKKNRHFSFHQCFIGCI